MQRIKVGFMQFTPESPTPSEPQWRCQRLTVLNPASLVISPACFLLIRPTALLSPGAGWQTDKQAEEKPSWGSRMTGRDAMVVEEPGWEERGWERERRVGWVLRKVTVLQSPLFGAVTVNVTSVWHCRFWCCLLCVRSCVLVRLAARHTFVYMETHANTQTIKVSGPGR